MTTMRNEREEDGVALETSYFFFDEDFAVELEKSTRSEMDSNKILFTYPTQISIMNHLTFQGRKDMASVSKNFRRSDAIMPYRVPDVQILKARQRDRGRIDIGDYGITFAPSTNGGCSSTFRCRCTVSGGYVPDDCKVSMKKWVQHHFNRRGTKIETLTLEGFPYCLEDCTEMEVKHLKMLNVDNPHPTESTWFPGILTDSVRTTFLFKDDTFLKAPVIKFNMMIGDEDLIPLLRAHKITQIATLEIHQIIFYANTFVQQKRPIDFQFHFEFYRSRDSHAFLLKATGLEAKRTFFRNTKCITIEGVHAELNIIKKDEGVIKWMMGLMAPSAPAKTAKALDAKKKVAKGQRTTHKRTVRTSVHFRRPVTLKTARNSRYLRKAAPATAKMDHFRVIQHPLTTESAMKKIEEHNTLVFLVNNDANKYQIKEAVQKLYNVKAQKVNTLITPLQQKKAYVRLTADYDALDVANKIGVI
ncbi:unnamed protein product [Caenorhabditis sp. 36 PRJEB53466]|nr:unnamed protein product [Caenorhabditis sp. 36 PRJEB53466]